MSVSGDNMTREQRLYTKALAKADEHIASLQKRIAELEAKPHASAGLIEAAEWHEQQVPACREQARKAEAVRAIDACVAYNRKREWHQQSADYFRARAAERSRK